MKTPITYYGGKQKLAREIVSMMPKHEQYVEPFFGGGAVFFAKPPSNHEVINDLNGDVINFWQVLKTDFSKLKTKIDATLHSESQHRLAKEILKTVKGDKVARAWAFWVQTNMSFTAKIGGGFAFDNLGQTTKRIKNKSENFTKELSDRLRRVEIFCRDAVDLIKLKDSKTTFFYCDPPYVSSEQGHYKGYTEADFKNLLDALARIKGKFLLSSYNETILRKYKAKYGWKQKKKTQIISAHKDRLKNVKYKVEVLTWNY
ncbi:DNA adenine methylase [Rhodoflexus caldus]|uniref:DNA adenine methylase n=1 Tax=Rhodoflexus caldus TaxID=2891236 RepID=UPI00202A80DA|nr:DNA adenine methylase [Rhodoflexus caldus]